MSYADEIFKSMCRNIIENGTSTEGEKVRPHWEDGELAYTIKQFGVVNRYDLSKEFPAITLRKTAVKSATDEMLWIFQKKSNNINELGSHVWDEWADENGSIGKAYGYQIGEKFIFKKFKMNDFIEHCPEAVRWKEAESEKVKGLPSATFIYNEQKLQYELWLDQMDAVIYQLKYEPFSRRIMTNLWHVDELNEMNLQPCAYSMTFNVTKHPDREKLTLNAILNQRSQDILAANNWNVCQYAVLVHMLAQVCDMEVGEFVHVIADCHIYDRHVDIIKELIERPSLPAPKFWLNPEVKDFYAFTKDDVKMIDYEAGPQVKDIPIAI